MQERAALRASPAASLPSASVVSPRSPAPGSPTPTPAVVGPLLSFIFCSGTRCFRPVRPCARPVTQAANPASEAELRHKSPTGLPGAQGTRDRVPQPRMGMEKDRGISPLLASWRLLAQRAGAVQSARRPLEPVALCSPLHQGCPRLLEPGEQEEADNACGLHVGPDQTRFPPPSLLFMTGNKEMSLKPRAVGTTSAHDNIRNYMDEDLSPPCPSRTAAFCRLSHEFIQQILSELLLSDRETGDTEPGPGHSHSPRTGDTHQERWAHTLMSSPCAVRVQVKLLRGPLGGGGRK